MSIDGSGSTTNPPRPDRINQMARAIIPMLLVKL
jgi:hypothetical protein